MLFNYVMVFLLTAGAGVGCAWNIRKTLSNTGDIEEYQNKYAMQFIVEYVKEQFAEYIKVDLQDMNMDKEQYELVLNEKLEMRRKLKEAAFGNQDAKDYIKSSIRDMLASELKIDTVNEVNKVIPFDKVNELTSVDMTEILIYAFGKFCGKYKPSKYTSKDGLAYMIDKYKLTEPHEDFTGASNEEYVYDISAKQIEDIYKKEEQGVLQYLDLQDRLNILAQRVFEQYKGFGPVDILMESNIDEIDCGVSGIPADSFDIDKNSMGNITYSYESIWIMYHGLNIHMSCLYFDSQAELIRVTQNVYRYEAPEVLSRKSGYVISTMKNGSRVVAVRPPFADSYAFFVRKFDPTVAKDPKDLFKEEGNEYIELLLKWLIRGHRNILFTGSQGTGKTTTMKAYVRYIPIHYNIRVQETTFEQNLRFLYPMRNIVAFQETANITAQDGLNVQKKTNGAVNIVGEIATAEAASWIIQTGKVAAVFTWGSHHAKTAADMVTAIRDNLLQTGMFSDAFSAEAAVAEVLNIDVHMEKDDDTHKRFMERITEIIPIRDHSYPTDHMDNISLQDKFYMDQSEKARRQTDRQQFKTIDLLKYIDGKYYMVNMPSKEMMAEMRKKLQPSQRSSFDADMKTLKAAVEKFKETHAAA